MTEHQRGLNAEFTSNFTRFSTHTRTQKSVTTAIVTAIRRQQSCGVSADKLEIDLVRTDRKHGVVSEFSGLQFLSSLFTYLIKGDIMNMHTQLIRPDQNKRSNPLPRITCIRWQNHSLQAFLFF
jgi:hypothetical protein